MVRYHDIYIPQNIAKDWKPEEVEKMIDISWALTHMWNHAIGEDWQQKISRDTLKELFLRM